MRNSHISRGDDAGGEAGASRRDSARGGNAAGISDDHAPWLAVVADPEGQVPAPGRLLPPPVQGRVDRQHQSAGIAAGELDVGGPGAQLGPVSYQNWIIDTPVYLGTSGYHASFIS